MDPLSDVLSVLKPQSYLTAGFNAGGEWAVLFNEQVGRIKCFAVTSGSCLLSIDGDREITRLSIGDCFVLPTGRSFTLGSDLDLAPAAAEGVFAGSRHRGVVLHNGGGDVFMTAARFDVNSTHASMLLRDLPPIIRANDLSDQAELRWALQRMQEEVQDHRAGSTLLSHHLAHIILIQVLRIYLAERPNSGVGWFHALSDPRVGAAIGAIHDEPGHHWTLGKLADRAGLSRSVFAVRFREKVGETPVNYLTRWRMILAGEKLACGERLADVAVSLGYASETAFNIAFKRVMGSPPGRYARRIAAEITSRAAPAMAGDTAFF